MNTGKRVHGLSDIKTGVKSKIRSMPGGASKDRYLDLYIMGREKVRFTHEMAALMRRKRCIESELKNIKKAMRGAARASFEKKELPGKGKAEPAFKTMALDY